MASTVKEMRVILTGDLVFNHEESLLTANEVFKNTDAVHINQDRSHVYLPFDDILLFQADQLPEVQLCEELEASANRKISIIIRDTLHSLVSVGADLLCLMQPCHFLLLTVGCEIDDKARPHKGFHCCELVIGFE